MRGDAGTDAESENEASHSMPNVSPANAYIDSDDDDDDDDDSDGGSHDSRDWDETPHYEDEDEFEIDEELEKNTEASHLLTDSLTAQQANASATTPYDVLRSEGPTMIYPGEGPNLLPPSDPMTSPFTRPTPNTTDSSSTLTPNGPPRANPRTGALARRKSTRPGSSALPRLELHTSRPVFEKNRCTVTLTHGDPDRAIEEAGPKKRRRRYLVASDLSDESLYAIQWAIGTVLREGDECFIVSVMETDTKLDTDDVSKQAKITNQRERQAAALALARQTTTLLERTRLNVRIYCQAIHAKVPRHMLIDMIDYLEPTLVLVGSRGLTKLKGMLLGSTSNYLVQKSSSPVMVTRRPLRVSRTVHRKVSSLDRVARVTLAEAAIEKESHAQAVDDPEEHQEGSEIKAEVKELQMPRDGEVLSRTQTRE
ncbi:adenine nucleotide alpha hydrolases-like protein [Rhodotorula sp. JG-1b]|nr:adenine nucleotide alpha hydrolases-like protein [Rhodotorula sp. JG-1b]